MLYRVSRSMTFRNFFNLATVTFLVFVLTGRKGLSVDPSQTRVILLELVSATESEPSLPFRRYNILSSSFSTDKEIQEGTPSLRQNNTNLSGMY